MTRVLLHEPWQDRRREQVGYAFAMWIFLATELLFFGALFFFYAVNRWTHPHDVALAASNADALFGGLNTAILMTSSLTIAMAERALENGLSTLTRVMLWFTLALGLAFVAVKGLEYHKDLSEDLWPGAGFALDGAGSREFWSFYWVATAVHAVHVTIGLGLILRLILLAHHDRLAPRQASMTVTTLYWHLVDVIWVVLYALIYLVGRA